MSQPAPSFDNGYTVPDGWPLTKAALGALFADIHARLTALLATASDMQAVIDAGTTQALAMVAQNVGPQIQAAQAAIAEIQQNAEAANSEVTAAFQQTITELQAKITQAEQALAVLLSGSFPADSVTETATRVFVSPAQKAEIAALRDDVDAKAERSAVYTKGQVDLAIAAAQTPYASMLKFA